MIDAAADARNGTDWSDVTFIHGTRWQDEPLAQVSYMTDKIPMKRCGTLEEIANLAAYILSPEASFTTGFTFDMTGGRATY